MIQDKEPRTQVMHKWEMGKLISSGKKGLAGAITRQDWSLSMDFWLRKATSYTRSAPRWRKLWVLTLLWPEVLRLLLSGRGVNWRK